MGTSGHAISRELQAAQQRLQQRRAQLQSSRSGTAGQQASLFGAGQAGERPLPTSTAISQLPPHLGWESAAVTATVARNIRRSIPNTASAQPNYTYLTAVATETAVSHPPTLPQTIKLYPDIAIGLLRQEQVAAGRLWLLLQAADAAGCGWVDEPRARQLFTSKRSELRFCGARQLRNLLAQGEGLFWVRANGRLWLRSVAKVAFALGVPRLSCGP